MIARSDGGGRLGTISFVGTDFCWKYGLVLVGQFDMDGWWAGGWDFVCL